jgi:DNA-binding response OmpR family regulator
VHLLVVEDDDGIGVPLERGLERAGFSVTRVRRGLEALEVEGADLVLLDLGLPDLDGYEVCRRLRAKSSAPIIVVTARADETDRVLGLELGADDYVVKPFGMRELVARVRAVARRALPVDNEAPQRVGSLTIDRRAHRVFVGDELVTLTPKEFQLLECLADDPGAVVPRQQIMDEVWDPHWYGPTKTLDVHIASLRKKLGDQHLIRTVRGVGFCLEAHT